MGKKKIEIVEFPEVHHQEHRFVVYDKDGNPRGSWQTEYEAKEQVKRLEKEGR